MKVICPKRHLRLKAEAVIFDMDGVITNTMPDHFKAWHKIFGEAGVAVTHLDVYRREGQSGKNTVRELFKERGLPLTQAQAQKILSDKEKLFKSIVKTRFIPGARLFLKDLFRHGVRLALVTGTSRQEAHRILPQRLWDYFCVTVTGDEVRHGKPHPEPYLKALRKLKIKPVHAAVIENAPFGIQSAKQAGLKCIALETSLARSYLREADYIFPSIRALRKSVWFY